MNRTRYMTEDKLIERGLSALMKALGPIETRRFLNLPRSQRLESRHRQWQDRLNQEHFFNALFGPAPASTARRKFASSFGLLDLFPRLCLRFVILSSATNLWPANTRFIAALRMTN
jgi:hypothetical protein